MGSGDTPAPGELCRVPRTGTKPRLQGHLGALRSQLDPICPGFPSSLIHPTLASPSPSWHHLPNQSPAANPGLSLCCLRLRAERCGQGEEWRTRQGPLPGTVKRQGCRQERQREMAGGKCAQLPQGLRLHRQEGLTPRPYPGPAGPGEPASHATSQGPARLQDLRHRGYF